VEAPGRGMPVDIQSQGERHVPRRGRVAPRQRLPAGAKFSDKTCTPSSDPGAGLTVRAQVSHRCVNCERCSKNPSVIRIKRGGKQ